MNPMAQYLADAAAMEAQRYVHDILNASESTPFTKEIFASRWTPASFLPRGLVGLFRLRPI